jgi:tetratricopeptide (TPR) repeat protein
MWDEFYWTYTQRDYEKAVAACERALELDPLQLELLDRLGTLRLLFGDFDMAVDQFHEMLDIEPNSAMAYLGLADAYARMGKSDEALEAAEHAVEMGGRAVAFVGILGFVHGVRGNDAEARWILEELRRRTSEGFVSSFWLATVHAGLGEFDAAFDALDRALEGRDANLLCLTFIPSRLGLHGHPRFEKLVRSIGLGNLLPITNPT